MHLLVVVILAKLTAFPRFIQVFPSLGVSINEFYTADGRLLMLLKAEGTIPVHYQVCLEGEGAVLLKAAGSTSRCGGAGTRRGLC